MVRTKHERGAVVGGLTLVALLAVTGWGCEQQPPTTSAPSASATTAAVSATPGLDRVKRTDFNRVAAELALPLFWMRAKAPATALTPEHLAVLWGVDESAHGDWVADGRFTPRFLKAYESIAAVAKTGHLGDEKLDAEEAKRRELIRKELSQGVHRLIRWDFRDVSQEDRAIVRNIMAAAQLIEKIYAKQKGWDQLIDKLPAGDDASKMMLYRNQGPWCVAPATEGEESCNAIPSLPKRIFGLYPASLQSDPKFCDALGKRPDGEKLLHQFVVVRGEGNDLKAVPYSEEYQAEMKVIGAKLQAAAAAIKSETENAFKAYLLAAAQAFVDNSWEAADELWSKMNAQNSKWYLRVGPDEVYFEPCNRKAGFHVSFARINQESLKWQRKLEPVKGEMEEVLAEMAGPPYQAREVSFHLPDFVDIVLNAGDARNPHGATIGQSLPNWGPVANEGRGRTVAMTNLYTDPDSRSSLERQASSMLCSATMKDKFTTEQEPMIMSIVLHEAAHNLGPAHEYRVGGKKASQIFGGPRASTLEELKAQTAALFFTDWLGQKKIITPEQVDHTHVRDIVWAISHISRGMYSPTGKPKPYSQLAAIQVGFLRKEGALEWRADELAANGEDKGCFEIHLGKFPPATEKLMRLSAGIKSRGDQAAAEALIKEFVDDEAEHKAIRDIIRERWLREPKASFVYSIRL